MLISKLFLLIAAITAPQNEIDRLLATAQQDQGVTPVELCDDDTFLRRVTLDLVGRIATPEELRQFRLQPDRGAKIDALLASQEFPRFWSEIWTAALVGYTTRPFQVSREPLRAWIETSLRDATPYDQMVRTLISAEGDSAFDGPVNFLLRHREEPAVKVSRMFLGVRLDCARCHDHPFDRWTREDFDRFNAFFQSVDYQEVSERNIRLTEVPREAGEDERPRFLTGASPRTTRWRDELALLITTCRPFARNYANRIWYHLLGRGIVQPPDEIGSTPAVAPQLLEFLADYARDTDFDVRSLIRTICHSETYQRSSGHSDAPAESHALFASYQPKPLTPEQLLRSLQIVLDREWSEYQWNEKLENSVNASLDSDFSQTWQYRDTVQDILSRLVSDVPVRASSVTALYEKILSRKPTDNELRICHGQPPAKIAFALIHSNEFRFNH